MVLKWTGERAGVWCAGLDGRQTRAGGEERLKMRLLVAKGEKSKGFQVRGDWFCSVVA